MRHVLERLRQVGHSSAIPDRRLIHIAARLVVDDGAQDLVEYALLSGFIGIAGVLLFPAIKDGMSTAYGNWNSAAQDAWQPSPPAP
jgi:Flp pilus assembly pilin Flp